MTEAVSRGRGLPAGIQILQLFGWRRSAPALEVHRGPEAKLSDFLTKKTSHEKFDSSKYLSNKDS